MQELRTAPDTRIAVIHPYGSHWSLAELLAFMVRVLAGGIRGIRRSPEGSHRAHVQRRGREPEGHTHWEGDTMQDHVTTATGAPCWRVQGEKTHSATHQGGRLMQRWTHTLGRGLLAATVLLGLAAPVAAAKLGISSATENSAVTPAAANPPWRVRWASGRGDAGRVRLAPAWQDVHGDGGGPARRPQPGDIPAGGAAGAGRR